MNGYSSSTLTSAHFRERIELFLIPVQAASITNACNSKSFSFWHCSIINLGSIRICNEYTRRSCRSVGVGACGRTGDICGRVGVPDSGWKVYSCKRQLKNPGKPCSDPFGKLCHQYLCVSANGETKCWGLNPSGSEFGSPGKNNDADKYQANLCKLVASDECMGSCVLGKSFEPLPRYNICPPFKTHCQDWAQGVLTTCETNCLLKGNV